MSALKKWALGGMICAAVALFIFATVFITGEEPGHKVMGVLGYVFMVMEAVGLLVFKPWQNGPPSARAPPKSDTLE